MSDAAVPSNGDSQGFSGARTRRVVTADDLEPHGMSCPICDKVFQVGDIQADIFLDIAENPLAHIEGEGGSHIPVVMPVCDTCADLPDIHERIEAIP